MESFCLWNSRSLGQNKIRDGFEALFPPGKRVKSESRIMLERTLLRDSKCTLDDHQVFKMAAARPEAPSEERLQCHLQLRVPMDFLKVLYQLLLVLLGYKHWSFSLWCFSSEIHCLLAFPAPEQSQQPCSFSANIRVPPAELCNGDNPDQHEWRVSYVKLWFYVCVTGRI